MSQAPTAAEPQGSIRSVIRTLQRIRKRVLLSRLLKSGSVDLTVSLSIFAILLLVDRLLFPGLVTAPLLQTVVLVSLSVSLFRTLVVGRLDIFQIAVLADQRLDLKERASSAVYYYSPLPPPQGTGDERCGRAERRESAQSLPPWSASPPQGTGDERCGRAERRESAQSLPPRSASPPQGTGDERCGRAERRESAQSLPPRSAGEWGELLGEDAARSLEAVDWKKRFPLSIPRTLLWSLVPLAASLAVYFWLPAVDLLGVRSRREGEAKLRSVVSKELTELDEKLVQLEKDAEKKAPDAKKLLELLRQRALKPEKEDPASGQKAEKGAGDPKKEGLVELTRREDQIKKGLEGGKLEPLKEALKTMKSLELKNSEVTRKVTEALKEGDFEQAKKALDDLKDELSKLAGKKPSELSAEEKARMEKLSAELSRLSKNSPALSKLSSALSRASSQLNSSDLSSALDSLSASQDELESLTKLAQEMDVLDQALELVQLSKEELAELQACPECGTPYCPDCGKPQCGCKPGLKPGGT